MRYGFVVTPQERIAKLARRLDELEQLSGLELMAACDELSGELSAVLELRGDQGVWQATRPGAGSRRQVAQVLGRSVAYVQKRASRYAVTRSGRVG